MKTKTNELNQTRRRINNKASHNTPERKSESYYIPTKPLHHWPNTGNLRNIGFLEETNLIFNRDGQLSNENVNFSY